MNFYLSSDLYEGDNPTWEQVYDVINSLDGKKFNNFYLELEEVSEILVAVGI